MSLRRCDDRRAEIDGGDAGQSLGLLSFLSEEGQGEVDAFDFT